MASSGAAAVRYALRTTLAPRLVHSSSAATAAFVHLSPNALGKRPEVWVTAQRRHFSWTPWKASSDTVDATAIETSTPSAASSSSAIPTATSSADNLSNAIDKAASSSSQTSITDAISNNTGAAVDAVNDAVSSTATTATTSNIASSASESTYLPGETLSTIIANNLGSSSSASAESLKSLLTSPEAVAAPATVADLASVGLGHKWYSLFGWATDFLISAHNFTGLPWWATIIGVNIFIRLILLRVLIPSIKHSHRWAATIPEQAALSARQKAATAAGNQKEAMAALLQMRKLWSEHDIHPLRSISLPVVQGATFFVFFVAIRRMATTPWPQFVDGGFGWVQNLTIPDPYYILPLTSALATIAVIRTGADGANKSQARTGFAVHLPNIFTMMSPIFFVAASQFPAAVTLFWSISNFYSLLQAKVLKQPRVKSILGIETPAPAPTAVPAPPIPEPTLRESFRAGIDYLMGGKAQIDKRMGYNQPPRTAETIIERPRKRPSK